MNEIQQLREWAQLANIPSETVSEQGDLVGFFQNFRPHGERLESVFAEHVLGQEVMDRVKECFSATANGETDAYFIPRRSESAADEASALLKAHFKDLVSIAKSMKDQELVDILSSVPLRQVQVQEFNAIRPTDDTPDGWIFDMITDYTTTLTPVETPLLLLKDAVYSIANDKLLQQYILWPIYRESSLLVDPYRSYFAVWSMGIRYAIPAPEACLFCVQEDDKKCQDQADAPWLINVTLPWECIMALIHDRWSEHQPLDIRALLLSSDECRSPFSVTDEGHCDFRGVRIDASFHKMTVRRVDFSSAVLGDGQFVGACDDCKFVEFVCDGNLGREFLNCVFHKARLNNSVFYGKFLNCDFSDANMTGVRGRHIRFERCTFENTNLRKASFYDSTFVDCKLINCTIRSGSLAGSSFDNCEMNDFDLSKTVMARVKGLE